MSAQPAEHQQSYPTPAPTASEKEENSPHHQDALKNSSNTNSMRSSSKKVVVFLDTTTTPSSSAAENSTTTLQEKPKVVEDALNKSSPPSSSPKSSSQNYHQSSSTTVTTTTTMAIPQQQAQNSGHEQQQQHHKPNDEMHSFFLTFLDPDQEARYSSFQYITSGFNGGKIWHAVAVLINLILFFYYHTIIHGWDGGKMFGSKYWIGLTITTGVTAVMLICLFVPCLYPFREQMFLLSLFTHWPAVAMTSFLGMNSGAGWPYRYAFTGGCLFFCTFVVQARFSRSLWFISLSPVLTLIVCTTAIDGFWEHHTPMEVVFWSWPIFPVGLLVYFERASRKSFLQMQKCGMQIDDTQRHMAATQDLVATFFAKTPTVDFLSSGKRVRRSKLYQETAMIVTDLSGFTAWTSVTPPKKVIQNLGQMFATFDAFSVEFNVEKISTVGDCFVGAIFPSECGDGIGQRCCDMLSFASEILPYGGECLLRIGCHVGAVTAAFVGSHPPKFDLFGDEFNLVKLLESEGVPGKIHASPEIENYASDCGFAVEPMPGKMGNVFSAWEPTCDEDPAPGVFFSPDEVYKICQALLQLGQALPTPATLKKVRSGHDLHKHSTTNKRASVVVASNLLSAMDNRIGGGGHESIEMVPKGGERKVPNTQQRGRMEGGGTEGEDLHPNFVTTNPSAEQGYSSRNSSSSTKGGERRRQEEEEGATKSKCTTRSVSVSENSGDDVPSPLLVAPPTPTPIPNDDDDDDARAPPPPEKRSKRPPPSVIIVTGDDEEEDNHNNESETASIAENENLSPRNINRKHSLGGGGGPSSPTSLLRKVSSGRLMKRLERAAENAIDAEGGRGGGGGGAVATVIEGEKRHRRRSSLGGGVGGVDGPEHVPLMMGGRNLERETAFDLHSRAAMDDDDDRASCASFLSKLSEGADGNEGGGGGDETYAVGFHPLLLYFYDENNEKQFKSYLERTGLLNKSLFAVVIVLLFLVIMHVLIGCFDTDRNRILFALIVFLVSQLVIVMMRVNISTTKWFNGYIFATTMVIGGLSALLTADCNATMKSPVFYTGVIVSLYLFHPFMLSQFMLNHNFVHRLCLTVVTAAWGQGWTFVRKYGIKDDVLPLDPIFAVGIVGWAFVSYFADFTLRSAFAAEVKLKRMLAGARGKHHRTARQALDVMLPGFVVQRLLGNKGKVEDEDEERGGGRRSGLNPDQDLGEEGEETNPPPVITIMSASNNSSPRNFSSPEKPTASVAVGGGGGGGGTHQGSAFVADDDDDDDDADDDVDTSKITSKDQIWKFPAVWVMFVYFETNSKYSEELTKAATSPKGKVKRSLGGKNAGDGKATTHDGQAKTTSLITLTDQQKAAHEEYSKQIDSELNEIHACFEKIESILRVGGIHKIKSIGTSLLAVSGIDGEKDCGLLTLQAANTIRREIFEPKRINNGWSYTLGIHYGPCFGAVLGNKSLIFDIFGDTINMSSRIASTARNHQVQVSRRLVESIAPDCPALFAPAGALVTPGLHTTTTTTTTTMTRETINSTSSPLNSGREEAGGENNGGAALAGITFVKRGLVKIKGKGDVEAFEVVDPLLASLDDQRGNS